MINNLINLFRSRYQKVYLSEKSKDYLSSLSLKELLSIIEKSKNLNDEDLSYFTFLISKIKDTPEKCKTIIGFIENNNSQTNPKQNFFIEILNNEYTIESIKKEYARELTIEKYYNLLVSSEFSSLSHENMSSYFLNQDEVKMCIHNAFLKYQKKNNDSFSNLKLYT